MKVGTDDLDPTTTVRTFLIAHVRGYTRFTRERGDAEAARLATKFAGVAAGRPPHSCRHPTLSALST